jgi:hypothetical protein
MLFAPHLRNDLQPLTDSSFSPATRISYLAIHYPTSVGFTNPILMFTKSNGIYSETGPIRDSNDSRHYDYGNSMLLVTGSGGVLSSPATALLTQGTERNRIHMVYLRKWNRHNWLVHVPNADGIYPVGTPRLVESNDHTTILNNLCRRLYTINREQFDEADAICGNGMMTW